MEGHWLALAYGLSAALCLAMSVLCWRRRRDAAGSAATALSVAMAGLAWWSAFDLAAVLHTTADGQPSAVALGIYPGVGAVVAGFWCLCRAVVDPDWRTTRRTLLLLALEPAVFSAVALANPWHGLVLTHTEPRAFGLLFWLHTGYSYLLLGSALLRVLRERRSARALQSRQMTTLLLAALPPVVGNVLTLAAGARTSDLSALFFVLTGLMDAWAVFRQGLLEVVPIARARVLEVLGDAVVVVDEVDRVVDANEAALLLVQRAAPGTALRLGAPAGEALGALGPVLLDGGDGVRRLDPGEGPAGAPLALDVRTTALRDRRGRVVGRAVVARDVTAAERAREELDVANAVLRDQLATIEALRGELAEQALVDPLTGLRNRRDLDARLAALSPAQLPLSVVLLDVDRFKAVNDVHGHAVGDRALQAVSAALRACVREDDVVVRYGGEEFVLLLPHTALPEAQARADEVRAACAAVRVPAPGGPLVLTVSAGVAALGPGGPAELLEQADRALYRAKAGGRDRVEVAALVS